MVCWPLRHVSVELMLSLWSLSSAGVNCPGGRKKNHSHLWVLPLHCPALPLFMGMRNFGTCLDLSSKAIIKPLFYTII